MTREEVQPQLQAIGKEKRKPMKRWLKWLIIITLALFLLVVALIGITYWYIKSISLDDIKSRHRVTSEAEANIVEPVKKIPAIMEGTVDKAASLVGKDIEGQDALDVAAILLNSGLSLKDIRYLQGNASYDLTTEEKQHIRDLLLRKLTFEEIELLRSITSKYGKHLVILNPDYPIEWVGERDPELIKEHEREWKKIKEAKRPDDGKSTTPGSTQPKERDAATTTDKSSEPNKPAQSGGALTDKQAAAKKQIDAKYDRQLAGLKTTCTATSNSLLQSILKDVAADPDISLAKLQTKFIGQLAEAESNCDGQFNELLAQSQTEYADAGISVSAMPDWKADYNKAKSDARAAGIAAIANKLNNK